METIYLAGGCLWGVQAFVRTLPGVVDTEAGRANGTSAALGGEYDGFAECVRTVFDPARVTVAALVGHLFEIIDPYSVDRQGDDVGPRYRTGIYSTDPGHLTEARAVVASTFSPGAPESSVTTAVVRTTLRLVLPVFTTRADCTVAPYAFHRFALTPRTRGAYFKSDVSIP